MNLTACEGEIRTEVRTEAEAVPADPLPLPVRQIWTEPGLIQARVDVMTHPREEKAEEDGAGEEGEETVC